MSTTFINIVLAFAEGFGLILSPCILPILPIILSTSVTGSKSRPYGIILGFIISFTVLTLTIRAIVGILHIPPDFLRDFAFVILLLLGIIMMSTYLTELFAKWTGKLANVGTGLKSVDKPEGGFWSGIIFGLLIGIIWTPCAGPIIAAVIVQIAIQTTTWQSMITVITFAIGAGVPMLLIALIGRQLLDNIGFLKKHTVLIRKLLGLVIIITVVLLYISTETSISFDNGIKATGKTLSNHLIDADTFTYKAPAIAGITAWINSKPLTMQDLRGKVVLIDFWTYSCINCIRTLPYLKAWYARYHQDGFEIIGVHSPEFAFEGNIDNVKNAVKKFGIEYPVAMDNHFITWRNYHNSYWPAQYLIAKKGYVVYQHVGEGDDEIIESNIRVLLNKKIGAPATKGLVSESISFNETPETYLGYLRAENFANTSESVNDVKRAYHYPAVLPLNQWALNGDWMVNGRYIVAMNQGASIKLHFFASKVFAVMGTVNGMNVSVTIKLNGMPQARPLLVKESTLYPLLSFAKPEDTTIELIAAKPGLQLYTFTFG